MVIRPDILGKAIDSKLNKSIKRIYSFSPRGKKIDKDALQQIITEKNFMLVCGKFEGIDERVLEEYNIKLISIGDFIVSSGEICALVLLDACVRLLPGVLGNKNSYMNESFYNVEGLETILEYPLYTRPCKWRDHEVPEVLLSGNHKDISCWRLKKAIDITKRYRPDLINKDNESYVKKFITNNQRRRNSTFK